MSRTRVSWRNTACRNVRRHLSFFAAGASLAGARKIIAVDVDDRKLDWAREFGATDTVNSSRTDPVESFHHAVNSKVQDIFFALYRDFPDSERVKGQEKF